MNLNLKENTTERNRVLWGTVAFVALLIALTVSIKGSTGLQWILSGLTVGSIYSLVAIGFSIIYASTRVINFAQGEFSMLGGLLLYSLCTKAGLPVPVGFLLAVIIVTLIGAGFERTAIHHLRGQSVITMIIVTIGFSIFLRAIALWSWGSNPLPIASFSGDKSVRFLGASLVPQNLWVFGFTAVMVILVFLFFNRTLVGKGMRAAAANPDAASMVGVSTSMSSLIAWALAAAIGAAAGIIIAPITMPSYGIGTMLGLKGFTAAVLGGLGNAPGAVVGGLVLGVLEKVAGGALPQGYSGYTDALAFLILILVLLLRPQGLLGKPEGIKV